MAHKYSTILLLATTSVMLFVSLAAGQQTNQATAGSSRVTVTGDNAKVTVNVNSTNYISNYNSIYDVTYNYDEDSTTDLALAGGNGTAPELAAAGGKKVGMRKRCPMEKVMKVGAGCVDGLVTMAHNRNGLVAGDKAHGPVVIDPVVVKQCCPVLGQLQRGVDTASDCLCTTLKVKALDLKAYVPLARSLLASCRANTTTITTTTTVAAAKANATNPPLEFACPLAV